MSHSADTSAYRPRYAESESAYHREGSNDRWRAGDASRERSDRDRDSRDNRRYDDRREPAYSTSRYEHTGYAGDRDSRPAAAGSWSNAQSAGSYLESRAQQRFKLPMPYIWTRSPSRSPPRARTAKRPRDEAESDEDRSRRRHRRRSSNRRRSSSSTPSPEQRPKTHVGPSLPPVALPSQALPVHIATVAPPVAAIEPEPVPAAVPPADDASDSDASVGPALPADFNAAHVPPAAAATGGAYAHGMRPGEGAAIAGYVAANKRVPRRGEVGWDGEVIQHLEGVGFVMSGSRHARMNAIRMRKENQVYTAEEKKMLALMHYEERQAREVELRAEFARMVAARMQQGAAADDADAAAAGAKAPQEG